MMTDDGSYGEKGLVTNALEELIDEGENLRRGHRHRPAGDDEVRLASSPRQYGIKTVVSMNPIMIDGTGMCGGCRLTVGGETKFACVDGPDFDGHRGGL